MHHPEWTFYYFIEISFWMTGNGWKCSFFGDLITERDDIELL